MKLYYAPAACSLSPHIVAREANVPVTLERVDLTKHTFDRGRDFYAINSKGSVPVLELPDGEVLTEGPAIVQYLADQNPASGLAPQSGSMERYRLQEWLNFVTSELHKGFGPLFASDAHADWKTAAVAKLRIRFSWLAPRLASRPFVMGDRFTVADAYLFTVLNWTSFVGISLSEWPTLTAYQDRISARPRVQDALRAEGLIK